MKYLISIITISLSLLIVTCKDYKLEKKRIGNNIVEAVFVDGKIEGFAKFYTLSGILEYEGNYINGEKNGFGRTFYKNGRIKDTMYYISDKIHGEAYNYASDGNLRLIRNNYYGLEVGDHLFFVNGKITEYYFDSFEGVEIVKCKYDSFQRCDSMMFNSRAIVKNMVVEKDVPVKKVFIYFPHPPGFEIIYKMGFTVGYNQTRKIESVISSNRLFLDTTFGVSTANTYYLSVDYKNKSNGSVVNVLFQKL